MSAIPLVADIDDRPARYASWSDAASDVPLLAFSVVFLGWSILNEDDANPAFLNIIDATDSSAPPVWPISLLPQESDREWFGNRGVLMENGVYLEITGTLSGSIFYRHIRR